MMKTPKVPTLYKITWRDIYNDTTGWISELKPVRPPVNPVTVGYILGEEVQPGYLTLASSYYIDEGTVMYNDLHHIPIGCVISKEKA